MLRVLLRELNELMHKIAERGCMYDVNLGKRAVVRYVSWLGTECSLFAQIAKSHTPLARAIPIALCYPLQVSGWYYWCNLILLRYFIPVIAHTSVP